MSMECTSSISYDKLWHRLIDLKMKKKDLIEKTNLSANVLAKMGQEESVTTMDTVVRSCVALDCDIGDAVNIVKKEV